MDTQNSIFTFYSDADYEDGLAIMEDGLLIVVSNGIAGTICDDEFAAAEAIVACQSLGFEYVFAETLSI